MTERDITRAELATMWERHDPMPEGLVEKVLVAIALENLDADYELLSLVERTRELEGVRGSGDAFTMTFSRGAFSLLLRVSGRGSHCRVDGWVSPAQPMSVTVTQPGKSWDAAIDSLGRFELPKLPTGLTRLWLRATEGADPDGLFATPTFEL